MKGLRTRIMHLLAVACLLNGLCLGVACADDDDHRRRKPELSPVDNSTYAEKCGACHFAYLPELLPSGSWQEILSRLDNHNGAKVAIDAEPKGVISRYLEANAAEKSRARRAKKIVRSLKGQTPTRITEVPYIHRKHDDISAEVFQRQSIGSFSNCSACHTTAEQGIFDDDNVKIPE